MNATGMALAQAEMARFQMAFEDVWRRREKKLPPIPPDGYAEKIRQ